MAQSEKRPEVFIALIAPIGINLEGVQKELCHALKKIAYHPEVIKLTDFITEHKDWFDLNYDSEFERYTKYINAGNEFCKKAKRRDALVLSGIAQVYRKQPKRPETISYGSAYIFRQIKRVEEIKTLRQVYGKNIVFLGCHSPRKVRVKNLVSTLLKSRRGIDQNLLEAKALEIIGIDENQKEEDDGQRFLDAYPYSDFILDCTSPNSTKKSLERFVECFFGHPFISPTRDEHGMYLAQSASLRSTDLSRQVGAAIFGSRNEIVSLGCNEVPASGGGTYWSDHVPDSRDFQLGYDSNARVRSDMIRDMFSRLRDSGWLNSSKASMSPDELSHEALNESSSGKGPLAQAMISDVIEYGRMVHAEMNAITDAARFGRETKDGVLYCTTMPCHLCTKLIISSGIIRVQYLQPYYKSMVRELYEDSVSIDEKVSGKVDFQPFLGVTPNGFRMVFEKGKRKNPDHSSVEWSSTEARPIFSTDFPTYLETEANVLRSLQKIVTDLEKLANPLNLQPGNN